MSSTIKLLVSALLILLLLGTAGFVYKKKHNEQMNQNSQLKILGTRLYSKGNLDDAVKVLTQASNAAVSAEDKATSDLYLGMTLMKRGTNEGGALEDITKGANLLAGIVQNTSVSSEMRANSATALASRLPFLPVEKYTMIIPTLNTVISNPSSIDDAYRLLLEKSIALKPNAFAMYSLAGGQYYIKQVTTQSLPQDQKTEIAKKMEKLVADADVLPSQSYSPEVIATGNYYRARAMTAANRVLNNYQSKDIEKAYQEATNYAAATSNAEFWSVQYYGYLSRFFYANYLLEFKKDSTAEAQITVAPFKELISSNSETAKFVRAFFVKVSDNTQPDFQPKKNALRVAEASPEFKQFLQSIAFK